MILRLALATLFGAGSFAALHLYSREQEIVLEERRAATGRGSAATCDYEFRICLARARLTSFSRADGQSIAENRSLVRATAMRPKSSRLALERLVWLAVSSPGSEPMLAALAESYAKLPFDRMSAPWRARQAGIHWSRLSDETRRRAADEATWYARIDEKSWHRMIGAIAETPLEPAVILAVAAS